MEMVGALMDSGSEMQRSQVTAIIDDICYIWWLRGLHRPNCLCKVRYIQ